MAFFPHLVSHVLHFDESTSLNQLLIRIRRIKGYLHLFHQHCIQKIGCEFCCILEMYFFKLHQFPYMFIYFYSLMPKNLKSISGQVIYAPILPNIFPHFSAPCILRQSCSICACSHCCRPAKKKRKRSLHHLFSNFISVMSCVSVTLRIPLSLNNLWGACVFLQPETMISPQLPNATAHLSSCCPSFPPRLSPLLSAPLHHSQVVSGSSRNRGRLSWSFSLRPG